MFYANWVSLNEIRREDLTQVPVVYTRHFAFPNVTKERVDLCALFVLVSSIQRMVGFFVVFESDSVVHTHTTKFQKGTFLLARLTV